MSLMAYTSSFFFFFLMLGRLMPCVKLKIQAINNISSNYATQNIDVADNVRRDFDATDCRVQTERVLLTAQGTYTL